MNSLVMIAGLAVLLIVGLILIWRGLKAAAEEKNIVPFSEIDQIKELQDLPPSKEATSSTPLPLTKHLVDQNFQSSQASSPEPYAKEKETFSKELETMKVSPDNSDALQNVINELNSENEKLKETLKREMESKSVSSLAKEDEAKLEFAEKQLTKAELSVKSLTEENHRLKEEIKASESKLEESHKKGEAVTEEHLAKFQELEAQINQLKQAEQDYQGVRDELTRATEAKQALEEQMKTQDQRMQELQEHLTSMKEDHGKQLAEARAVAETQRSENELEREKRQVEINKQLSESTAMIEELKSQLDAISANKQKLEQDYQTAQDFNTHLQEKEKVLQYELTKAKAQSVGLEKICEDFKTQIEQQHQSAA